MTLSGGWDYVVLQDQSGEWYVPHLLPIIRVVCACIALNDLFRSGFDLGVTQTLRHQCYRGASEGPHTVCREGRM